MIPPGAGVNPVTSPDGKGKSMGRTRCIISLATNDKHYPEGLLRLRQSVLRSGFTGEFLCWPPGSFPEQCPAHEEVPFAFKPYCFLEARRRGMDLVLWLDSSCVVVRRIDSLFRAIEERGYVLFKNRDNMLGQWASDEALRLFELSREDAMSIQEVNAAAIGLNMRNAIAVDFFAQWYEAAREGPAFRGVREHHGRPGDYLDIKWNRARSVSSDPRVRGHRHDQTVAGMLAHRLGMELTAEGIASYSQARRRISLQTVIVTDRDTSKRNVELASLKRVRRDKYLGFLMDFLPGRSRLQRG
jgi:hypothetical protein